jgi:hypothetical protein
MTDFPSLVKGLTDIGGWAAFAALAIAVITLLVTGKLVPGSVTEAQRVELQELREMVKDDILVPVKEIGKGVATLVVGMGFLTEFVKDVARREGASGRRDDR